MLINRPLLLVVCLTAAVLAGACTEQLDGGNACPSLCTEQQLGFKDTVFEAADVIDTMVTLPGLPSIGTEPVLLVARYAQTGDSVVSYAVFRYDSVVRGVRSNDTLPLVPFTTVDNSYLEFFILPAPTGQDTVYIQDTVTFSVYDVFVDAPDLDTALVHARFSGTPVGTLTLSADTLNAMIKRNQTVKIDVDTAFLTAQITSGKKVWLGVMVTGPKNIQMALASQEGAAVSNGSEALLGYVGRAPDTLSVRQAPNARPTVYGPAIPPMADYQMNVIGSPATPAGILAVGGLPSNRTLIRFKFPAWLVDSSTTVVRANLELYQVPFTAFRADSDSLFMQPLLDVAAPAVTDLSKIGILVLDQASAVQLRVGMQMVKLPAASSALDTIPLVRTGGNVFNYWRARKNEVQRAVVLTLIGEGFEPRALLFYGPSAAPALRPRVHVSYVPHSAIGLP